MKPGVFQVGLAALVGAALLAGLNGFFGFDRTATPTYTKINPSVGSSLTCFAVKVNPGVLLDVSGFASPSSGAITYEEFWDVASDSAVTLGTTVPKLVLPIGGQTGQGGASGSFAVLPIATPISFGTGIFVNASSAWNGTATLSFATSVAFE